MSTRALHSEEPGSPFPDFTTDSTTPRTDRDDAVEKTATARFPRLNAGLVSAKNWMVRQINDRNSFLLSLFVAVYPIGKLFLAILAHFIAGVAITFPPVLIGLLIGAATLFLITLFVHIKRKIKNKEPSIVKNILLNIFIFTLAPITGPLFGLGILYKIGKKAKVKIQAQMQASRTPSRFRHSHRD